MLGSLVIVFPTPHEGGELILRHQGEEWTFDSAKLLHDDSGPANRLAYVAFFSDVAHEVLPVLSGRRITVTYNLYWGRPDPEVRPSGMRMLAPGFANTSRVKDALSALLDDPAFLRKGGTLGFGLRHLYPFGNRDPLGPLYNGWLKGGDWALYEACEALGFEPYLRLVWESDYYGSPDIIMDDMSFDLDFVEDEGPGESLLRQGGSILVKKGFGDDEEPEKRNEDEDEDDEEWPKVVVHWVTDGVQWDTLGTDFIGYGNEASIDCLYMKVCLMVEVGPPGTRIPDEADDGGVDDGDSE